MKKSYQEMMRMIIGNIEKCWLVKCLMFAMSNVKCEVGEGCSAMYHQNRPAIVMWVSILLI